MRICAIGPWGDLGHTLTRLMMMAENMLDQRPILSPRNRIRIVGSSQIDVVDHFNESGVIDRE